MEDIDEVLKRAQKLHQAEPRDKLYVHRLSDLSSSRSAMKDSIKERIKMLYATYISLASYVPDDEYWEALEDEKKRVLLYKQIAVRIDEYTKEIKQFDSFSSD